MPDGLNNFRLIAYYICVGFVQLSILVAWLKLTEVYIGML